MTETASSSHAPQMKPFCASHALLSTFILLNLVPVFLAHIHDGEAEDMGGGVMGYPGGPSPTIPAGNATDMEAPNYFRQTEYSALMLAHIVLMTVGWVFVLPLGVMLSIARSSLAVPIQFAFLIINGVAVALAAVYNANTPDLYSNNSHHKIGWVLIWIVAAQSSIGLIGMNTRKTIKPVDCGQCEAFIPITTEAMAQHQRFQNLEDGETNRLSNDSGHGTQQHTESFRSQSLSSLAEDHTGLNSGLYREFDRDDHPENPPKATTKLSQFMTHNFPMLMSSRLRTFLSMFYETIDRLILIFGFVALTTGIVTYGGVFRGPQIFSGLAHFIKGGVFFWYGILTLGRWAGCFSDLGWAWNVKPPRKLVGRRKSSSPSAEFVESFLIFFYGSTNVFLEHLAGWGGAWSAQDLEHISITIMFFGGGLCGMLIESRNVRKLLNSTLIQPSLVRGHSLYGGGSDQDQWREPKSYGISMNPIPSLVVLLLGMMMSSHHQASMVSTMVHKQWGTLLMAAAFARAVTYVIFYISPPTSILPSRPPSELITAFCLMCGGCIFMASSSDTIAAMEYNNLGAMFMFTVTTGIMTFLMAWIVLVIAIKGWAVRREGTSRPILSAT